MARFDRFLGPTYTLQSKNANVERCINLYPEITESGMALYGVPGLQLFASGFVGGFRGAFAQDGRCFVVAGDYFYEVLSDGTTTAFGPIVNDGRQVSIHSNGIGGNQLFLVSGLRGYIFSLTANTLTLIADPDFPTGSAVMGEFFDQYFFVLKANSLSFQISSLSNGSAWAASDTGTRSRGSDNIVTIIRLGLYLWLLGSRTSEPWYDSGAANFPFAPVPSALLDFGSAAAYGACRADNAIFFLSRDERGARMVLRIDQGSLSANRVSTFAVEYALNSYPSVATAVAYSYQEAGHTFVIFTDREWPTSWVYDCSTQMWHERNQYMTVLGEEQAQLGICHCYAFDKHLVGDRTQGLLYEQKLGLYSNADSPLRWLRRAPHLNDELKRTYHSRFQVDFEPGVGLTTGQGSDPKMTFRSSNDGGYTWASGYPLPMGKLGEYGRRSYSWRLGMSRNRVYELSGVDPVKTALVGAYIQGTAGAN